MLTEPAVRPATEDNVQGDPGKVKCQRRFFLLWSSVVLLLHGRRSQFPAADRVPRLHVGSLVRRLGESHPRSVETLRNFIDVAVAAREETDIGDGLDAKCLRCRRGELLLTRSGCQDKASCLGV